MIPKPEATELSRDRILGISLCLEGASLRIECAACKEVFDSLQSTMGGVPMGDHVCPQCKHRHTSDPQSYNTILTAYFEDCTTSRAAAFNAEAMRVATSWHQSEPWRSTLEYKGIDLGSPTEREIVSYFNCAFIVRKPGSKR